MADWRSNFAGMPHPHAPGEPLAPEDIGGLQAYAMALSNLVPEKEIFTLLEGARVGDTEKYSKLRELLGGKAFTQNELAGIQRIFEGKRIGKEHSFPTATALNVGYELDKGLAQALGRDKGFLTQLTGDAQFGPSTSDASLANVLMTQLGIGQQQSDKPGIAAALFRLLQGRQ